MANHENLVTPYEPSKADPGQPKRILPFWRRYIVPLFIFAAVGSFEIINWTTAVTSEWLVPQFATSAQTVIGRMVFFIGVGLTLGWLLATRQVSWAMKGITFGCVLLLAAILLSCIRSVENTGNNHYVVHWRWEQTQDQRLAEFEDKSKRSDGQFELDPNAPVFSDFLGPKRDGVVPGPTLQSDLKAHPPKEIWRRPMGQGYAGFVIAGGLAVTIEQRGNDEVVVALDLKTGKDVWTRAYPGFFKENLGGDGPRATPTIAGDEVYALGAAGLLACLDLATGNEKWQTNILTNAGASNIKWGMCGAPLVTDNKVIVNPGGVNKNCAVVAHDRASGKQLWCGGDKPAGYSTPVLASLHGVTQVLVLDAKELAGYDLDDGRQLWRFDFATFNGINVCQPIVLPSEQVFVSAGYDTGAALVQITRNQDQWKAEELWKSKAMKCKMSSCIYYDGYIYGLDDGIFACIDARNGKRKWKSGRYEHGQFLLRNDLFVIQAESGDFAFVAADPAKHRELALEPALGGGKTWNAPALAGNLLLLRNHFEAVLFELATLDEAGE